jgi:hypothetical protein
MLKGSLVCRCGFERKRLRTEAAEAMSGLV